MPSRQRTRLGAGHRLPDSGAGPATARGGDKAESRPQRVGYRDRTGRRPAAHVGHQDLVRDILARQPGICRLLCDGQVRGQRLRLPLIAEVDGRSVLTSRYSYRMGTRGRRVRLSPAGLQHLGKGIGAWPQVAKAETAFLTLLAPLSLAPPGAGRFLVQQGSVGEECRWLFLHTRHRGFRLYPAILLTAGAVFARCET